MNLKHKKVYFLVCVNSRVLVPLLLGLCPGTGVHSSGKPLYLVLPSSLMGTSLRNSHSQNCTFLRNFLSKAPEIHLKACHLSTALSKEPPHWVPLCFIFLVGQTCLIIPELDQPWALHRGLSLALCQTGILSLASRNHFVYAVLLQKKRDLAGQDFIVQITRSQAWEVMP